MGAKPALAGERAFVLSLSRESHPHGRCLPRHHLPLPELRRAHGHYFKVNEKCPSCGLTIEKGDGAFLGPFVISYAVTAFGVIIPIILMHVKGWVGATPTLVLCFVAALGVPVAFYRLSWGWWLMLYYFFLPDNLPANREGRPEDDE